MHWYLKRKSRNRDCVWLRRKKKEKIESKGAYLGFLERGIIARLEVTEVAEDTLLELFHVLDRTAKCLDLDEEGVGGERDEWG